MKDYPFEYYCKWCGKPIKRKVPDGDMCCSECELQGRISRDDLRAFIRVVSFYNGFYSHGRRKKNG